jgi:hypothetical protein
MKTRECAVPGHTLVMPDCEEKSAVIVRNRNSLQGAKSDG